MNFVELTRRSIVELRKIKTETILLFTGKIIRQEKRNIRLAFLRCLW